VNPSIPEQARQRLSNVQPAAGRTCIIYWKFHVVDGQNRSLIFRVKRMPTSFHRRSASRYGSSVLGRVSALPKREWSMTPSGDWSLRITKLEGTAYDWSHCLVAPVQIAANQQLPSGDRSRLRPVIDFWLPRLLLA